MQEKLHKILKGYNLFRKKYHEHDDSVMEALSEQGQDPKVMVVACCDSRVDPAVLFQCDPGDLFVVRNVANIIPPFECDEHHHGTSAALEVGISLLNIEHLVILGHSQCAGLRALLKENPEEKTDFIHHWVSLTNLEPQHLDDVDECAKMSLNYSYENCLTFPWIKKKVDDKTLIIHRWFFNIKTAEVLAYVPEDENYIKLEEGIES